MNDNADLERPPSDLVEILAAALEAENVRCKISLWQKDESGYGFGPKGDPCPINLTYLAEFCVGVLRTALIDGPKGQQKPRASVEVTFCMDDGCMYSAGHDGPHDITWQAEHSDGTEEGR